MTPYGRHTIFDSDIAAVCETLRSDFLTTGPRVEEFEDALCAHTGAAHAVACASGTAALHLSCLALEVKPGERGVTSPITFLASANCLEYCRGEVGFVDIDPATRCLSPKALADYCSRNAPPKVVIPVDYAGLVADLGALQELKKTYRFSIIQDAAHSFGSTYTIGGERFQVGCGAHADLTILSFHPVKSITTAEGGAVLTNDRELADRLRRFRSHGMTKDPALLTRNDGPWYYEMHTPGFHYRLNDVQCALGLAQLSHLAEFKSRRREIVDYYTRAFAGSPCIETLSIPEGQDPCFHLYVVRFREGAPMRRHVYDTLVTQGIHPQVHYIPVYWQPYYRNKYGFREGLCSHAEHFYEGCLSLPLYPTLSREEMDRIVEVTLGACARYSPCRE